MTSWIRRSLATGRLDAAENNPQKVFTESPVLYESDGSLSFPNASSPTLSGCVTVPTSLPSAGTITMGVTSSGGLYPGALTAAGGSTYYSPDHALHARIASLEKQMAALLAVLSPPPKEVAILPDDELD